MKVVEKRVKVVSVRSAGEKTMLTLSLVEPSGEPSRMPRPEEVIRPISRTDAEKVARETTRAMVQEMRRHGIQTFPMIQRGPVASRELSILLTREEYAGLGKPTVFDRLTLKIIAENE